MKADDKIALYVLELPGPGKGDFIYRWKAFFFRPEDYVAYACLSGGGSFGNAEEAISDGRDNLARWGFPKAKEWGVMKYRDAIDLSLWPDMGREFRASPSWGREFRASPSWRGQVAWLGGWIEKL